MTYFTLHSLISLTTFIFMQMNHPLAMGLILLTQTVLTCLISGMMTQTFWFSYILFLVFLGGMLVLFIYVTSLASNEMFSLSTKLIIVSATMLLMMNSFTYMVDWSIITQFIENKEMVQFKTPMTFYPENTINLNKLYNFPTSALTLMMINYLLITLVASVKITDMFKGPLRPIS